MKIKIKQESAKVGDLRTKSRFLWFPKIINSELRWLEFAQWEEMLLSKDDIWTFSQRAEWTKNRWIN